MISKYLTYEFWGEFFETHGFKKIPHYWGDFTHMWYEHGEFVVGYKLDLQERRPPHFIFNYKRKEKGDITIKGRMTIEKSNHAAYFNRLILFLEAIANPKLMPLCITVPWAQKFVSIFLQQSAVENITTTEKST